MSKSIIIGSEGYLGANITGFLESRGENVYCYGRQKKAGQSKTNFRRFDITDPISFANLDLDVDYIYFFAGLTGTGRGFEQYNQFIDTNEKGLLNLLNCMKLRKSKARIIFPSTRLVYKGAFRTRLSESAEKETNTIYALNKLACESFLKMYRNAFDVNYTIFRICVPYGHTANNDYSYGTVGFFQRQAKAGQNISLFGDGSLMRTFTHVQDICEKIYIAVQKQETVGNIYNISGEDLTLYDVAIRIAEKYKVRIDFQEWPDLESRIETGDTIFDGRLLDSITYDGVKKNIAQILD
ncbi:MAG: SDR family oxidoreductase [Flavobacterium sp.]|nr:MAG: SDR family oxidoreductase [Flavobacterium sp.]